MYRIGEAAERLGITRHQVRYYANKGAITYYRTKGGQRRFAEQAINAFNRRKGHKLKKYRSRVWLKCEYCGKKFSVPYCKRTRKYCSRSCSNASKRGTTYNPREEKIEYPNAGRRKCLKCRRWFDSWDTSRNRICPECAKENATLPYGEICEVRVPHTHIGGI